jgi:hypothetical protein
MAILDDADMQTFQDLFADLALDKACTIKRPSKAKDSGGRVSQSLTTIATVNALVKKPGADIGNSLQDYAMLIAGKATTLIEFPYGQDVEEEDQLTFAGSTKTLVVQKVLEPGSFPVSTGVLAVEVS